MIPPLCINKIPRTTSTTTTNNDGKKSCAAQTLSKVKRRSASTMNTRFHLSSLLIGRTMATRQFVMFFAVQYSARSYYSSTTVMVFQHFLAHPKSFTRKSFETERGQLQPRTGQAPSCSNSTETQVVKTWC